MPTLFVLQLRQLFYGHQEFSQRHCQIIEEDRTIGAHVVKKKKVFRGQTMEGTAPELCEKCSRES